MKVFLLFLTTFLISCGQKQQNLNTKFVLSDNLKPKTTLTSHTNSTNGYLRAEIRKSNDDKLTDLSCNCIKNQNVLKVFLDNCPASMVCDKIDIVIGSDGTFIILYESIADIRSATFKTIPTDQCLTLNKSELNIGDTLVGSFDYSGFLISEYIEPPSFDLKIMGEFTCIIKEEKN